MRGRGCYAKYVVERTLPQILKSVADRLRVEFNQSKIFEHRAEAGGAREALVNDFLARYLPGQVQAVHSAEIASAHRNVSPQMDIVFADLNAFSLLDMSDYRLLFNESVFGVMEIKTKLDKRELEDACEKIRTAKALPKTSFIKSSKSYWVKAYGKRYDYKPTFGIIFAFDSVDLNTLARHFGNWCSDKEAHEMPDSIWVLGKGFIQWVNPENGNLDPGPVPGASFEVLDSVEGVDVLLPLVLHLGIHLATLWAPGVDLTGYLTESDYLGSPRTRYVPGGSPD